MENAILDLIPLLLQGKRYNATFIIVIAVVIILFPSKALDLSYFF